jgi:hypothetical protein
MQYFVDFSRAIDEVYSESLCSRKISRSQLNELRSLSESALVNPQQNRLIKRLLHATRRGWVLVTD